MISLQRHTSTTPWAARTVGGDWAASGWWPGLSGVLDFHLLSFSRIPTLGLSIAYLTAASLSLFPLLGLIGDVIRFAARWLGECRSSRCSEFSPMLVPATSSRRELRVPADMGAGSGRTPGSRLPGFLSTVLPTILSCNLVILPFRKGQTTLAGAGVSGLQVLAPFCLSIQVGACFLHPGFVVTWPVACSLPPEFAVTSLIVPMWYAMYVVVSSFIQAERLIGNVAVFVDECFVFLKVVCDGIDCPGRHRKLFHPTLEGVRPSHTPQFQTC